MNTQKIQRKANNGITLIALVITIIVLLILAGVSIATLTGENGILTQANKAKTKTNNANIEEQVKLAFLGSYGTDGKLDYSQLAKNLEKIEKIEGVQDTITEGSFPLTVTVNGEEIKIFDDGTIFNSGEWDRTASDEDCFYWASDDPNDEGYGTVIGYTSKIENYTKLKYPSRCTKITFSSNLQNQDGINSFTSRAFTNNILKVEIPETVTLIGSNAFGYMTTSFIKLEEITIPDSVTSVGNEAFNTTPWYNNQPDGVVYVGKVLYKYKGTMPSNTNIQIKDGTTEISDHAFSGCSSLSSITIPSSITRIEDHAFSGCSSLSSITIPSSVTSIGYGAFADCSSLTSITIPNRVTSIENSVFFNCSALTSITIPNSVTSIGSNEFYKCSSLTSITIPDSVTSIGSYAFYGWTSSQTINIKGYTSAPSGWNSRWNHGCSATINWNQ